MHKYMEKNKEVSFEKIFFHGLGMCKLGNIMSFRYHAIQCYEVLKCDILFIYII
jgi:hypothetical protein